MFKNMKIRTKIFMLVGLLGFIALFVGIFGVLGMNDAKNGLKTVYNDRVLPLKQLKVVSDMYALTIAHTASKVRNGNLAWADGLKNIEDAEQKIQENWKAYLTTYQVEEEKKLIDEATPLLQRAESSVTKLKGIFRKQDKGALNEYVTKELYPTIDPISDKFNAFIDVQCMAAKSEYDKASGTYKRDIIMFAITILIGMLSACAFTIFIIHQIMNTLGGEPYEIEDIAKRISEGDLRIQFKNDKQLTGAYASMKDMAERLKQVLGNVKSSSESLASASHELSASAEQMSRGVTEQAGRANQIATASNQMSQTVVDVAKNSSNIASSSLDTLNIADKGQEIVTKSVEEVKAIADTVNESAKLMSSLGMRSKQIGDIVSVIKDIADQTNLLALNAAIEAARAGEQGRGFAVVADEVRKLAERTTKATSEISGMIVSVQEEMEQAVVSMVDGTERVAVGVEFSEQAGEALRKIVGSVTDLQSMVQQIATATEEMSTASEQISGDIETIANVSRETSASSEHVSQASSDLARLANELHNVVELFKV
jgi:methyl-accepting chemotaxis protein